MRDNKRHRCIEQHFVQFLFLLLHWFFPHIFQSVVKLIQCTVISDTEFLNFYILHFSFVQLLSRVWLFVTPWTAARQASLSITNSRSLLKLMFIESVMPSNHFILCRLLFLAPWIFPSILFIQFSSVHFSRSVVSNSLQPHELQRTRPPCPSPAPGVHSISRPWYGWSFLYYIHKHVKNICIVLISLPANTITSVICVCFYCLTSPAYELLLLFSASLHVSK